MKHLSLYQFLDPFFRSLNQSNIKYCVLKKHQGLPHQNKSRDIDILVAEDQLEKVKEILLTSSNLKVLATVKRAFMNAFYIYGITWEQGLCLEIDLVTSRSWKGINLLENNKIFESSIKVHYDNGYYMALPESQDAWINTIFSFFNYQKLLPLTDNTTTLLDINHLSTTKLLQAFHERNTANLANLKNSFIISSLIQSPLSFVRNIIRYSYCEFKLLIKDGNSFNVCFLGPDGSGKSTLIEMVYKDLKLASSNTNITHLKPLIFFKSRSESRGVVTEPHAKKERGFWASNLKIILWFIELWIDKCKLKKNYRLNIYDRSFVDILVDPKRYRFKGSILLLKMLFNFIPKFDQYIVLTGDPEVIYNRKKEVPLEETKRQVESYQNLSKMGSQFFIVNNTHSLEESHEQILQQLTFSMMKKSIAL